MPNKQRKVGLFRNQIPLSVRIPAMSPCSPGFRTTNDPMLLFAICKFLDLSSDVRALYKET